jgi:hypothetical protein
MTVVGQSRRFGSLPQVLQAIHQQACSRRARKRYKLIAGCVGAPIVSPGDRTDEGASSGL